MTGWTNTAGGGAGFMAWKIAVPAGLSVGALALAGWYILPSLMHKSEKKEAARGAGAIGAAFVVPMDREEPPPRAKPADAPVAPRPTAPIAPAAPVARPRPSSFAVYRAKEPPPPVVHAAATPSKEEAQKIAGMTVLRAEAVSDIRWYLMPGDKIQCLDNEPKSNLPGAAFSVALPEGIRGRDGKEQLVPAGARAVGTVVKPMEYGDMRLAAVLTHIEGPTTTDGRPTLVVPLGSGQAGDGMGGAGLPANVDNHFWERLGTVATYALLDATTRIASGVAAGAINGALNDGNSGVNVNVGNFGGMNTGRGLAGRAFDRELNKPPTVDRPQAQQCTIFIRQPIDFRAAKNAARY